jgi:hypothetical protein
VKRSTLLAGIIGAVLVGGGIYGITRATSSSSTPSTKAPTTSGATTSAAGTPTPALPGATPTERAATTTAGSTPSTTASSAIDPDKGGAVVNHQISPEAAARAAKRGIDPAAAAAAPKRTGETQIRPMPRPEPNGPLSSEDEAIARQKQFKKTITKAACTAPDIGERLAQMPAAEGKQLMERCAAVGVTITPAKK